MKRVIGLFWDDEKEYLITTAKDELIRNIILNLQDNIEDYNIDDFVNKIKENGEYIKYIDTNDCNMYFF